MARLFDIVGTDITLDANILAVPAFQAIWDRDKSKEKSRALKELKYIIFFCDFLSPYKDLQEGFKERTIIGDLFKDNWEPDKLVEEATTKYLQLQETPNMRLLLSAKRNVDKLANYFDSIDFTEVDSYGKPKYSAKDLSSNLKDVGQIVKSLSMLEKQVQTEILEKNARGQTEIGPYELPKQARTTGKSRETYQENGDSGDVSDIEDYTE
jgi:hypothetical protein